MEQEKFSKETIVEVRHNFYSNKKEWMEPGEGFEPPSSGLQPLA